jgi:hypothetical protein
MLSTSFSQAMSIGGALPLGRTISVGGSLVSGASISVGLNTGNNVCIAGQVIINANSDGSSWSTSAPVSVRCNSVNVALSPIPSYTNLSSTFGGGAVGEAPFNFHATDCTPAHNASVAIGTFPSPVILRHYGPVLEVGSGAPVIVYARPTGTGTWTDHTSDFKFALSKRDVDITQKVTAILGFFPGYDYRIVPITDLNNSNALRCLDVLNKPAVRSYEYRFNITQ